MEHHQPRRLMRSTDRLVGGVAAGVADYLDVDPTLVRIGWVVAVVVGLPFAVIAYLALWMIMPLADASDAARAGASGGAAPADRDERGAFVLGLVLIVVGAFFLLPDVHFMPWLGWRLVHFAWPALLVIGGGVLLLMRSSRAR